MSSLHRQPEPAVLVDDVVVRFGEITAVDGVSFAVEQGEVFGLLGPNGAGKTSTLRVLTTLLRPTDGRARVAGHDTVSDGLQVRAAIGYIPQAISVDAALTGRQSLEFYARVSGVPRRERNARVDDAIDTMGLASFVDRLARTLSGGMLRRLEVATALLTRPRVLFLDEPTVGLDPTARRSVWVLAIGTAAFASMSMVLAAVVKTRERFMGIGQLIVMPLFFASSALYPLALLPAWLRAIARVNPLTYEVEGMRRMLLNLPVGDALWIDFLVTIGFCAAFAGLAARLYPRAIL